MRWQFLSFVRMCVVCFFFTAVHNLYNADAEYYYITRTGAAAIYIAYELLKNSAIACENCETIASLRFFFFFSSLHLSATRRRRVAQFNTNNLTGGA